jgi:hypothetical protein
MPRVSRKRAGRIPVRKRKKLRRRRAPGPSSLSEDCRCQCAVFAFISGPAEIKKGRTEPYRVAVNHGRNPGCTKSASDCGHDGTTWSVGPATARVELANQTKDRTLVKVQKDASGNFTLKADPTGKCKCKGTDAAVACESVSDTVTIKIVD